MDRADAPALTKEIIAHPAVKKINVSDKLSRIKFYITNYNIVYGE